LYDKSLLLTFSTTRKTTVILRIAPRFGETTGKNAAIAPANVPRSLNQMNELQFFQLIVVFGHLGEL
jgi:hypothetical protein